METADIKKKKKSDVYGIKPAAPTMGEGIGMEDLGSMKLEGIMKNLDSDRELESIKEQNAEVSDIRKEFRRDPEKGMSRSVEFVKKMEKLRRKGK